MDKVNQNCDEQLKIIVRQSEYSVSKKLICSSVPYFEKMFCCDLLESKENKVTLDFDERAFDAILNWIHTGSVALQMDYVISLYDAADYLMINERLFQPCFSYFHENFTIEHIPVVLQQVTKVSKLISSEAITSMVCRHFLTIANTNIFLDYPVETVEAILNLDLMVYSEYQILEAITKWVNCCYYERKELFQRLLSCVRWSSLDSNLKRLMATRMEASVEPSLKTSILLDCFFWELIDLNNLFEAKFNELIETQSIKTDYDRCKQNFFIAIKQKDDSNILIDVFDNEFCCAPLGYFTRDDSMSLEFVHGENISDVLFDSGSKGIRIDWIKKTFRWLDFKVARKTYYSQLIKFIVGFSHDLRCLNCYLQEKFAVISSPLLTREETFLEYGGKFMVIGKNTDNKWFGIFPVKDPNSYNNYVDRKRSFQATISDNHVYILTENLEFFKFNIENLCFFKEKLFEDVGLNFNDLILTSHAKNDDKVILVNKSSGKVHFYFTKVCKWVYKCKIMNVNYCSENSNAISYKLIAFTSTFLPVKVIKPLYRRKVN